MTIETRTRVLSGVLAVALTSCAAPFARAETAAESEVRARSRGVAAAEERLDVDAVLSASSAAAVEGAVFDALRAPALEALRVCGPVSGARGVVWPAAEFAALLARCAGSLREVALERVPLEERELRGIRKSVRVVVELCGRSD